jgi:hypothetical protein
MHTFQKEIPAEHTSGDALQTTAADTTCPPAEDDKHPAASLPASGPDTSYPTSSANTTSYSEAESQAELVNVNISPPSTSQQPLTTSPESGTQQQSFGQVTSATATSLTSYTALESRAALASIARRLLRDVSLGVDVSFQKSLHPIGTDTSDAHSPPLSAPSRSTVALSAFLLNTLTPAEQRQVVRAMWRCGAGVIVSTNFCNPRRIFLFLCVGCHCTGYLSIFSTCLYFRFVFLILLYQRANGLFLFEGDHRHLQLNSLSLR